MPRVFELARDAGVDSAVLHGFAQIHAELYDEAVQIAIDTNEPISITPNELEPAHRVFRKELTLPKLRESERLTDRAPAVNRNRQHQRYA